LTHIHASFSGVIYFEATAFFSPSPPSAFGVIYFEAMRRAPLVLLFHWAAFPEWLHSVTWTPVHPDRSGSSAIRWGHPSHPGHAWVVCDSSL